MDYEIEDKDLLALLQGEGDGAYPAGIGIVFRRRIRTIADAPNEQTLRQLRSWNLEKLKGNRSHQYSARLNRQYRLIIEFEERDGTRTIIIKGIEDYH